MRIPSNVFIKSHQNPGKLDIPKMVHGFDIRLVKIMTFVSDYILKLCWNIKKLNTEILIESLQNCVKYKTRILMEIPCHFRHKLSAVWSIRTPNSMTIPCHLCRFYLFSMLKHILDFGQVQVVEFPWHFLKNVGISICLVSFSTKLLSKRREKIRVTFFTG